MKREGRRHGLVRTFGAPPDPLNRRPGSRPHKLASPPTAGSFSKPTGKPVPDPSDPVPRPRDRVKGTHMLRSGDIVLSHRLHNWRVVAAGNYILDDDDDETKLGRIGDETE